MINERFKLSHHFCDEQCFKECLFCNIYLHCLAVSVHTGIDVPDKHIVDLREADKFQDMSRNRFNDNSSTYVR